MNWRFVFIPAEKTVIFADQSTYLRYGFLNKYPFKCVQGMTIRFGIQIEIWDTVLLRLVSALE